MLPSIIAVHVYSLLTHRDDGGAASYSSRMSAFIECWMRGPVHSLAFALKPLSHVYMHNQLALRRASVKCLASKDLRLCLFCAHTADLGLLLVFPFMPELYSEGDNIWTQSEVIPEFTTQTFHMRCSWLIGASTSFPSFGSELIERLVWWQ